MPSKGPTFEPSISPTLIPGSPTFEPSKFPTLYPTTFTPSSEPSQKPTTSPSLNLPVISYFTVIQRIQEVTESKWRSSSESDTIFKQTISIITGVEASNIAIISLSDISISSAVKRFKTVNTHRLLLTSEVNVNYTVTYSGDSIDTYVSFKNDLDFALTTGSFDIYLHTYAVQYGCYALVNATSTTTASYTEPIVISSKNVASNNDTNYAAAVGASLSVFAICSCCFFFCYRRYTKIKKEKMEEDPNIVNKDNFLPSDLGFELSSKLGVDAYDISRNNSLTPQRNLNFFLSPDYDDPSIDPSIARLKLREKNNRMSLNRSSLVVNPILEEKNEFEMLPEVSVSDKGVVNNPIFVSPETTRRKVNRPTGITGTLAETSATVQNGRRVNRPTGVIANIQVKNALLATSTTNSDSKPQFARRVTSTLRNSVVQNSLSQQSDNIMPVQFGSQNNSPSQSPVFTDRKSISKIPPPPPPPPTYNLQSKALAALSEGDEEVYDTAVVTNSQNTKEIKKRVVNRGNL